MVTSLAPRRAPAIRPGRPLHRSWRFRAIKRIVEGHLQTGPVILSLMALPEPEGPRRWMLRDAYHSQVIDSMVLFKDRSFSVAAAAARVMGFVRNDTALVTFLAGSPRLRRPRTR